MSQPSHQFFCNTEKIYYLKYILTDRIYIPIYNTIYFVLKKISLILCKRNETFFTINHKVALAFQLSRATSKKNKSPK